MRDCSNDRLVILRGRRRRGFRLPDVHRRASRGRRDAQVYATFDALDLFARFALQGLGTPAPVAPPQHLVVTGLYRHVRNPMYVSVLAIICGQALLFGDWLSWSTVRCSGWPATCSSWCTRNRRCSGHSAPNTRPLARTSRAGFRGSGRGIRDGKRCWRGWALEMLLSSLTILRRLRGDRRSVSCFFERFA